MTTTTTPYDEVPYPTFAHAQLHPDRIGTVAHLLGIDAAPAADCRYLKLGCGDAGTLLALAYALPGSRFVGYDLAPTAVARRTTSSGHSASPTWRCARATSPRSPTTSAPSTTWSATGCSRGCPSPPATASCARAGGTSRPTASATCRTTRTRRVSCGRCRGRCCATTSVGPSTIPTRPTRRRATSSASSARADPPATRGGCCSRPSCGTSAAVPRRSFVHDEMAEINTPFWLHEFVALAGEHGLRFLGEAEDVGTTDVMLSGPAQALLANLEDEPEAREQYLDFFVARRFRQTLLCRADRSPVSPVDVRRMEGVLVASPARPTPDEPVDLAEGYRVDFTHPDGIDATLESALAKAALCLLAPRWPAPATYPSLLEAVHRLTADVRPAAPDDETSLGAALLQLVPTHLVRLSRHGPTWPTSPQDLAARPVASLLARLQALGGAHAVANLRAEPIALDLPGRVVLEACDGTRDQREPHRARRPRDARGRRARDGRDVGRHRGAASS